MAYSPWYVEPEYWLTGFAEGDGFYQLNAEIQKVAPSAIIELFELQLNTLQHGVADTYRFHAGTSLNSNGEVVWAGNAYMRFPVEADGFEYSGNGQLPRPKVRVSNIMGTITALLLSLPEGLEGAKFTRIRTLARYLDAANFPGGVNPYGTPDPTAEFPREVFYVDRKTAETRDVVEFELAAAFDLAGVRAPKRQCISNICQWVYRSAECGYAGPPVADSNDTPIQGFTGSPQAIAYYSAKASFDATVKPLADATTALGVAQNNLNAAQSTYLLAEVRFNGSVFGGGTDYVRQSNNQVVALWGGVVVSLGLTYRRGELMTAGELVQYWRIERWELDAAAVASAQTAYNAALATFNTAQSNYNTTKAAMDAALATWQASPSFQNDINISGDVCGKQLSSCELRFGETAELPFGSFPGIGTYFA